MSKEFFVLLLFIIEQRTEVSWRSMSSQLNSSALLNM